MDTAPKGSLRRNPLDWALRLFADVRAGEATTALILGLNIFLLLTAYYLLKVAREPLILIGGGAEVKSYASVGQSILLVAVTSAYGALASRVGRMALITWVTLFFVVCLVVFWALGASDVPLGVPFFLWVGIFNVTAVAQFWSFAADIYDEEQGKRLFPVIGIGSSVGAVAGAWIADLLIDLGSPFVLMLIAGAIVLVSLLLTYVAHRREGGRARTAGAATRKENAPIGGGNGFALVLKDRYLLLFAALIFVLNWVTKTGDYVFDKRLVDAAHAAGGNASAFIGEFKARYFEWVNGVGVVLQLFVVSRVIKYLGLRWALLIMPLASLGGYSVSFAVPVIGAIFVARVGESALDYSLSNTTRQSLWLVTSRQAKYKAKQIIDTFVVRAGDAMSAGLVWVGVQTGLGLQGFVAVNIGLASLWLIFAILLAREYARKTHDAPAPGVQPEGAHA